MNNAVTQVYSNKKKRVNEKKSKQINIKIIKD
jgi:hypothetical protein